MGVIFINPYRFGFNPLSLSPALWLDASDTSTITASAGAVSQWNDKSGNGRNMSQATSAAQPITGSATQNGLNVLSFDGSDHMTHDAGSDAITLSTLTFAIVAYDNNSTQTVSTYRRVFSSRRSATGAADFQSPNFVVNKNNTTRDLAAAGNGSYSSSLTYLNQTTFLIVGKLNSSGTSVALNGGSFSTTSVNASIGTQRYLRVGAGCISTSNPPGVNGNEVWNGRVMEILLFPSDLDVDSVSNLRTYLNAKWAVY